MSSTASENHHPAERRRDYRPTGTSQGTSLFATLKRTITEFSEDNLSDWAASLTYYGLLALFPALIALVGLLGLVGDPHSTTKTITQIVTKIGPELGGPDIRRSDHVDHRAQEHRRDHGHRRPRRCSLVGVQLRRRVHARRPT